MIDPRPFVLFLIFAALLTPAATTRGEEPHVSYIFPAGGQRGTTVKFRVGGHYLHGEAALSMYGAGVAASDRVREVQTIWFEGPIIPLPASQQREDYPKDHAGEVRIAADAPLGARWWRVRTSQGVTPAMPFVIGDLPEVVEEEIDGRPIPVEVKLPVTINGRIFPREDVDIWVIEARKGQTIWCDVEAARLGSPLSSRLEVIGPDGRPLAENSGYFGDDAFVRFTAPADGTYQVRIHDAQFGGLQHHVYRLTISAGPHVDLTYPAGAQRGSTPRVELIGTNVPVGQIFNLSESTGTIAASDAASAHRLQVGGQWTNTFHLHIGDLPEELEKEPNNTASAALSIEAPRIANGRIEAAGDLDHWSIALAKDQELRLDLRAARLGSPLDGVLTVLDSAGKELARSEDISAENPDCQMAFRAPADGNYIVRVAEQFASRGGPRFVYRLTMDTPGVPGKASPARPLPPDFRLTLARDTVTVLRGSSPGGAAQVTVNAERRGGFDGPIELKLSGLPPGVSFSPTAIPAKQNSVQLTFKADTSVKIGGAELIVEGTAEIGQPKERVTRAAAVAIGRPPETRPFVSLSQPPPTLDRLALAVTIPTPFKFKSTYQSTYAGQGSTLRRRYTLERRGYEGPLTVMLADRQGRHLQGVTGPKLTVPAGATEFEYPVQLPPWLEVGRTSRSNLMAIGEIVDADGSRHRVSFTTQAQSEQIVVLADPGPLSVTLPTTSITAKEGGAVEIKVKVGRGPSINLPVRLELAVPPHIKGVAAEPVEVPASGTTAKMTMRFSPGCGPFNMPLKIRGTAARGEDRYLAEAAIDVVK